MKHITPTILIAFLVAAISYKTAAQCNNFFAYEKGDFFEQATYNEKGKEQDRQTLTIKDVIVGSEITTYKVSAASSASSHNETYDLEFTCEDGTFRFDGQELIASIMNQMQAEGMTLKLDGDASAYPPSLAVGDQLENNTFTMTMSSGAEGMMINVNTAIHMYDRNVESKEFITTPAGTFDCYKISYKMTSTTEVMGMKTEVKSAGVEYITPRFGVVRSEQYDEKGKVQGKSELTKTSLQ